MMKDNLRKSSVDVFRSIAMMLMLFVNDSAGMKDTPKWLGHAHIDEDMMGFSDTIFPAFLFCVGMSTFLALQHRREKGEDWRSILGHIFRRTFALVVMGLFAMNMQEWPHLSRPVFEILMVVGAFLTWNVCPSRKWSKILTWTGVLLLTALVVGSDLWGKPFHTGWWGILGLIGWTYMVCAIVFLITKGNLWKILVACLFVHLIALICNTNWIPNEYFSHSVTLSFIPGGWGHHALGVSGMLAVALMVKLNEQARTFLGITFAVGILFFILGCVAHPHWIISKILCTPTWVYFCLAIYFPLIGFLHWLADWKEKGGWFRILKPAATATLTCYVLPYLIYPLMQLTECWFPAPFNAGMWGLFRSACFSMAIIGIVAFLQRYKMTLKI